jgi:two-component system OmpR family response regulator
VLSRNQLITTVYGDDHHISARTIDTHVRNLRAKLAAAGAPVIETVHGVGYRGL